MRGLGYSRALLYCIHTVFRLISVIYANRKLKEEEKGDMDPSVRIVVAPLLVQFLVVQCNLQFALCTLCFAQCTLHFALGNSLVHRPLCTSWNSTRVKIISLFPSLLVNLSSLFICIRSLPLLSSVVKKGAWTDILVFAILY